LCGSESSFLLTNRRFASPCTSTYDFMDYSLFKNWKAHNESLRPLRIKQQNESKNPSIPIQQLTHLLTHLLPSWKLKVQDCSAIWIKINSDTICTFVNPNMDYNTKCFFWGEILTCFSTHSRTKHEPKRGGKSRGKIRKIFFEGHTRGPSLPSLLVLPSFYRQKISIALWKAEAVVISRWVVTARESFSRLGVFIGFTLHTSPFFSWYASWGLVLSASLLSWWPASSLWGCLFAWTLIFAPPPFFLFLSHCWVLSF